MEKDFLDIILKILSYITERNLELVPVLIMVGLFIKKKVPKVNDAWIIFILYIISVLLMLMRTPIDCAENLFDIVTQSIYVTGASVLINESPKQMKKLFGNTISNKNGTP